MEAGKRTRIREIIPFWSLLEYGFLRFLSLIINFFPVEISTWLARRVGDLLFEILPKRKKTALENLSIAYGDSLSFDQKKKIGREAMRNLATSLMEFFRIPAMLREASGRFVFEGTEHLDAAFKKGSGLIFVISHLGSWEYLAFLPYLRGYPCSVVVRETRNPFIYRWIQKLRNSTRLNPIDKKNSIRQILKELKNNHLVAILIDQWAGVEGLPSDFFGKMTSTTSIPARLAARTGAALVPGYCIRTKAGRYKIIIYPEVPFDKSSQDWEKSTTDQLNRLLEKEILKYPEQWAWTHRRWKKMKSPKES